MASDITVREAADSDAGEVIRLLAQLGHAQPGASAATRLEAFMGQGQHVIVAEAAGGPDSLLGAATLHITPVLHRPGPIGRMTAVVVDESARGKGIGRALVEAAERFLAERGCVLIEVTSNKKRADAHAFYERLGYASTSFRFAKALAGIAPPIERP
jgi:GNAT superfamily N-acetyltransferase